MTNEPEPNTRAGEALKPHHDCEGEGRIRYEHTYAGQIGWVLCERCDYHSRPFWAEDEAEAITAWNTRPLPQPSECKLCNGLNTSCPDGCDLNALDHITQLEAQITKLQADGDKLAGALERFAFLEMEKSEGLADTQYVWEIVYNDRVRDWFDHADFATARQALTEWKDRA